MTLPDLLHSASPLTLALLASLVGGTIATTVGALPALVVGRLSPRASNAMLAFAAGVMLAATVFSLLLPGFALAQPMFGGRKAAALAVVAALIAGGLMMAAIHRFVPHEHFQKGPEGPGPERIARVWLFVFAITVHNFPEGLSMGVGAASGDAAIGLGVTLGIGLQNLPEGLAVAAGMMAVGYTRGTAFLAAFASGVVEPLGGIIGAGAMAFSDLLLPWALAFAAGAMLFVISSEVIPETHRPGFERGATAALFTGFAAMFFLAATLS